MSFQDQSVWHPGQYEKNSSEIVNLMKSVGVESYDDLRAYSLDHPEDYWKAVCDYCCIEWSRPPSGYLDASAGVEFPSWFPGARLNWANSVLAWAKRPETSGQVAVVSERENGSVELLTFAELDVRVRKFAAGLAKVGVKRGDRVGLLLENGIEATISLLAIVSLGGVVVPLFSGFGVEPIVARLESAGASSVIASTEFMRRGKAVEVEGVMRDAWSRLPDVKRLIWKAHDSYSASSDSEYVWSEVEALATDGSFEPVELSSDDPFMVIYTSGTTGKPKGIVHTHGSFPIKIAHDAVVHFDVRPGDVFCWPADMGWIAGTLVLCSALLRGASLVCYDGAPDYPDWSRMSKLIERHRVTHFGSAPTLIRGMAANEDLALQGDVSSVRLLITAGEAIDPDSFLWFQKYFGHGSQPLINYTGGTEASGALLSSVVVRSIVPGGFNTVSPGVDADIVNADGSPVREGEVGELALRSPFVGMTHSFWQDDERYLETYWQTIPGLWVHGDLVTPTEDGHYFVVGRSDDTIKVAGKRLGPAEVEDIALEFPEVSEAAAIGVNDEQKGQKLLLFVVPDGHFDGDRAALEAKLGNSIGEKLGKPFKPSRVYLVSQLPKTRSSKIMRRVLRSVYCGLPAGDLSSLDNPSSLDDIRTLANGE